MLSVVVSETMKIDITFMHIRDVHFEITPQRTVSDVTQCDLTVSESGTLTQVVGMSACVVGDRFEKEVGRKLALTRALKNTSLPREARRAVWQAYFGRKGSLTV